VARALVPDTTFFIDVIRRLEKLPALQNAIASGRLYISAVVVAELYAGTRAREEALQVDRIVQAAVDLDRLLTPVAGEWSRAGRFINRRVRIWGDVNARLHLGDVLIVVSAARVGGTVVSANVKHMEGWVRLARRNGLDVELSEAL
jgi:predicted nucleic acid-binding protein